MHRFIIDLAVLRSFDAYRGPKGISLIAQKTRKCNAKLHFCGKIKIFVDEFSIKKEFANRWQTGKRFQDRE
jgi:hypothetical protein